VVRGSWFVNSFSERCCGVRLVRSKARLEKDLLDFKAKVSKKEHLKRM
jgi:hypothetical protein